MVEAELSSEERFHSGTFVSKHDFVCELTVFELHEAVVDRKIISVKTIFDSGISTKFDWHIVMPEDKHNVLNPLFGTTMHGQELVVREHGRNCLDEGAGHTAASGVETTNIVEEDDTGLSRFLRLAKNSVVRRCGGI